MTTPRLDQFLRGGLEILASDGSDGLTISALCSRLRVTKGSFYHHFGGMSGYVDELLAYWEKECNYRPIEKSRASGNTRTQVDELTRWSVNLPHSTEAAIRSWGSSNPAVSAAQGRVDAARQQRIYEVVSSLGVPEVKAKRIANMNISILIGYQHRTPRQDTSELYEMFEEVNLLIFSEIQKN